MFLGARMDIGLQRNRKRNMILHLESAKLSVLLLLSVTSACATYVARQLDRSWTETATLIVAPVLPILVVSRPKNDRP